MTSDFGPRGCGRDSYFCPGTETQLVFTPASVFGSREIVPRNWDNHAALFRGYGNPSTHQTLLTRQNY